MVMVQSGAVKFKSVRKAAEAVAAKTGEPVQRVYMRLYMRLRAGVASGTAVQKKARKYTLKAA